MIRHELTFETPERAHHFVRRLHLMLVDVATFRDGTTVLVWDVHLPPQTDEIARLAKVSSATWRLAVR